MQGEMALRGAQASGAGVGGVKAPVLKAGGLAVIREALASGTPYVMVSLAVHDAAYLFWTLDAALAYIRDVQPAVEFADREQSPPGCYTRDLERHAAILALARSVESQP